MTLTQFRPLALLLISTVSIAPSAMAEGLSPSSRDTFERRDDIALPVETTAGDCPTEIRIWQESAIQFEAGDSIGMMLDVSTMGQGKTEFMDSQQQSVTFRTPLNQAFYNCVGYLGDGNTLDEAAQHYRQLYDIWFGQGHVYFQFDIGPIAPQADENWYFANITHQDIVGQYPYVRWTFGD
ncbi:hypothetical protein [Leptothoe kymatousa]|uniref:Uncharacterized protein n=1 Tax=Leptothoe kymatousa TAU-MAC 1615 TaxID=2364775 RepID=A0ABS5Y5Q5_9CYAN|nr:hypothetical protein [Leptothoe kymatousa]MBT9313101.1 hypothetical protein [Leptothoe kymatousa TAU-MAC 1615]